MFLFALLTNGVLMQRDIPTVTGAVQDTLIVNSADDDGTIGPCDAAHCTLREAIAAIGGGGVTIDFSLTTPVTISLTAPLTITPAFEANVQIVGPGSNHLTIDGGNTYRPFLINDSSLIEVSISGMTIANGRAAQGGGIYTEVPLTLTDVRLVGNYATGDGGAIYQTSFFNDLLSLTDVTITSNDADGSGAGIYSEKSRVEIASSTISDNAAGGNGGGIFSGPSTMDITVSTISGNSAGTNGGGIYSERSTVAIGHSTISDNSAGGHGGGIFSGPSTVDIRNSTVSGNSAGTNGGGIYNNLGTEGDPTEITLENSTIANNTAVGDAGGLFNGSDISSINSNNSIIASNSDTDDSAPDCRNTDGTPTFSVDYTLIGDESGCDGLFASGTGNVIGTAVSPIDPLLMSLADNGGSTLTHELGSGSSAIDAGDPSFVSPPDTDQRGLGFLRVINNRIDMGAYEFDPPLASSLEVNTTNDSNDGSCDISHCSLREAILAANGQLNSGSPEEITFNIPGAGPYIIQPTSALPTITEAVLMGESTPTKGDVILDGSLAGTSVAGLTLSSNGNVIKNIAITGFSGAGIAVLGGTGNIISGNNIYENGGLGIDLNNDGVTENDVTDGDVGPNSLQNYPVLFTAAPDGMNTTIQGRLAGPANTSFDIDLYANSSCDPSSYGEGHTHLGTFVITTDAQNLAPFEIVLANVALTEGQFVTATATDPAGNTSEFSQCAPVQPNNTSWPNAFLLNLSDSSSTQTASASQRIAQEGESRWYKFGVEPESDLIITLSSLPVDYNITVYRDIAQAYTDAVSSPEELRELTAEFAAEAFSAEAFSAEAFSAEAFSAEAFSAEAFSAEAFSAAVFSAEAFSAEAFSAEAFSAEAFSAEAFSAEAFSAEAFSAEAFSAEAFSSEIYSPEAFANAQVRSILGVSAFSGLANEGIQLRTWNNTGEFYVRVSGRNGAFDVDTPFQLDVAQISGSCGAVSSALPSTSLPIQSGSFDTLIVTDLSRIEGSDTDKAALQSKLTQLAARNDVNGIVVDVGSDARVAAANTQADSNVECPYAKNLVAEAIEMIVDSYWEQNSTLQYLVLVGGDDVIPFFRSPDQALLANEQNYSPPVLDSTASQASLRLGYVLTQDQYGSRVDLDFGASVLPIPALAIGRLVETPSDIITVIDAYLNNTTNGVIPTPSTALVTGYDFLWDVAEAVQDELEAGLGSTANTLINTPDISPTSDQAWTAEQLGNALLGSRHDLIFLAGHFSASGALAADYSTRLGASELANSNVDLINSIVFSAGCHSGYNIVNAHGVPNITEEPDWAQAFAQKGAAFIGGTGYQYGDTDFIEYSERLYLYFSQQLRRGTGPVAIGTALAQAKIDYLSNLNDLKGIHEKSFLVSTLFGLPMLRVDLPSGRGTLPTDASIVNSTSTFATDPGLTLGLRSADVNISPTLSKNTATLLNIGDGTNVTATYWVGSDGVASSPAEPVLPQEIRNVSVDGFVLRGVGFRGGSFVDELNITPLTGAPTTEIRGVHALFSTEVFYPLLPWRVNYYNALADPVNGITQLFITPLQHSSTGGGATTNTARRMENLNFRLYYSNYTTDSADGHEPAVAAMPSIENVSSTTETSKVDFEVSVVGDPAAGIQQVWVTYYAVSGPWAGQWQSLDLTQNSDSSTQWQGTLPLLGTQATDVRYIVQAVNGLGLVATATNFGAYYTPGAEPETEPEPGTGAPAASTLTLQSPPTSGTFGTSVSVSAILVDGDGSPISGQTIKFILGSQQQSATTGNDGVGSISLPLSNPPGTYQLNASFVGTEQYASSSASGSSAFTINKQPTSLALSPTDLTVSSGEAFELVASLTDSLGGPLREQTVFFIVSNTNNSYAISVITDFLGQALLTEVPLPQGSYSVDVYFSGTIPLPDLASPLTIEDSLYLPTSTSGTLTIATTNNAPVAVDDSYSVDENGILTIAIPGVLHNDTDLDNDSLTASLESSPINGNLSLSADGSFVYTPTAGFSGTDTFTYKANDGSANSNVATVTITVSQSNAPPVAVDDSYVVDENNTLTVDTPGVLGNDTDLDKDSLTAILESHPSNGLLSFSADGSFIYTPTANFSGAETFTYKANDGNADSNVATVTITVRQSNTPPVAEDDEFSTDKNTLIIVPAFGVLENDADADQDLLSAVIETEPSNGSVQLNLDGSFSYTPTADFVGSDSFAYTAFDGTETSNVAIVTILVNETQQIFATCGGFDVFETANGVYEAPDFPGTLIVGTNKNDWLRGTSGPDLILGLKGNDDIFGRNGDDVICGGNGVDIIQGNGGNDSIYGEKNADWLIGNNGDDLLYGGAGWDDLSGGSGSDQLFGGAGYDVLIGGRGSDELFGENGPDALYGSNGKDKLFGGNGSDVLFGGSGNDELDGGKSNDYCKGNSGWDTIINCENAQAATSEMTIPDYTEDDIEVDTDAVRFANDGDGEHAIIQRIQELFLPLISQ
ncbi:MAG: Ig-like domain-containing protein [Chloroflexota bacterium]